MNYSKMLGGRLGFADALSIDMSLQRIAPDLSTQQREDICKFFEGIVADTLYELEELKIENNDLCKELRELGKEMDALLEKLADPEKNSN